MPDLLRARVHLIVAIEGRDPFSVRTDVLTVVKDPDWAHAQANQHVRYALEACGIRDAYDVRPLSLEWLELFDG